MFCLTEPPSLLQLGVQLLHQKRRFQTRIQILRLLSWKFHLHLGADPAEDTLLLPEGSVLQRALQLRLEREVFEGPLSRSNNRITLDQPR